ncbi:hypothetical protein AAHC03_024386 [Spirometra sp. Aus1]
MTCNHAFFVIQLAAELTAPARVDRLDTTTPTPAGHPVETTMGSSSSRCYPTLPPRMAAASGASLATELVPAAAVALRSVTTWSATSAPTPLECT